MSLAEAIAAKTSDPQTGSVVDDVTFLRGQLLVASPSLRDSNFTRTVIAIASHDEDGALGVILNRRASALVSETVPDLAEVVADDQLFIGGPVHNEAIVLVAEFDDPREPQLVITGTIGLLSERADIDRLATLPGQRRVFAGYAGWAPDQLEAEIEREDWFVAPAKPDDLFSDSPMTLWRDVLERMGGEYRLVARMPVDVSVN